MITPETLFSLADLLCHLADEVAEATYQLRLSQYAARLQMEIPLGCTTPSPPSVDLLEVVSCIPR